MTGSYTTTIYEEDGVLNVNGTLKIGGTTVTASATEINQAAKTSAKVGISAGSTLAVTAALHNGATINLDTLTGSVCTLPAATGSGAKFKFLVTVLATSNSHKVQVANASDFMIGMITTIDSAAVTGYVAANSGTVSTNSDTITLNRSTTGSVSVGEYISVEDVAANTWAVNGQTTSTGTAATPFSAAV
jgi:hypothetical protein